MKVIAGSQEAAPLRGSALQVSGHIAGLDYLRGAAILGVLLCHSYDYDQQTTYTQWHGWVKGWIAFTSFGHLGVHLFFVLSGFLITGILLDGKRSLQRTRGTAAYADALKAAARNFYGRRARRILPAYCVVLAALLTLKLVSSGFVAASLAFVVNLRHTWFSQYPVMWSLAVEEQFYLIWPCIVWLCPPRATRIAAFMGIAVAPIARLVFAATGHDSYMKLWDNVDYLMYGALIADLVRSGTLHVGNIRPFARRLAAWSTAGIAVFAAIYANVGQQAFFLLFTESVGRLIFVALFCSLLLMAVARHQSYSARTESASRAGSALAFFGYISYGLYLVHMLIFAEYDRFTANSSLSNYKHDFAALNIRAALCVALSVLLAWVSRTTLEAWFLRPKPASTAKGRADAADLVARAGS